MTAPRPGSPTTRIMGIDPGSQRTGIGVIDVGDGGRAVLVHAETLNLLSAENFPARLGLLCDQLEALLNHWQPQQVAIESVFMDKNATSALKLGHARGAAIAMVVRAGHAVHEYAPRVVKQSLVGRGAADKDQVQHMVRILLNLKGQKLEPDAADALAIALTHAHMFATAQRAGTSVADLRRR